MCEKDYYGCGSCGYVWPHPTGIEECDKGTNSLSLEHCGILNERILRRYCLCVRCIEILQKQLRTRRRMQREGRWTWYLKKIDVEKRERKRAIAVREAVAAQYDENMPESCLDEVIYRMQRPK